MHPLRPDVSVTHNTLQGKNIIVEIGQPHAGMTQKCVQIRAIGTHVESDHRTAAIEKCNLGIHGRGKVVLELSVIIDTAAFVSLVNERDTGGFETKKLQKIQSLIFGGEKLISHKLQIVALSFLPPKRITEYDNPQIGFSYGDHYFGRFSRLNPLESLLVGCELPEGLSVINLPERFGGNPFPVEIEESCLAQGDRVVIVNPVFQDEALQYLLVLRVKINGRRNLIRRYILIVENDIVRNNGLFPCCEDTFVHETLQVAAIHAVSVSHGHTNDFVFGSQFQIHIFLIGVSMHEFIN